MTKVNTSLEGILVVSFEQAVAAPFCSSRMADAGARVIKIERKDGDFARGYDHVVRGESAYFIWLNRGKESLIADIKNADDAALLHRMIAKADVFIQNLAPGAAQRAGFGSEELRARHPRLITVDISGYGDEGPLNDMKAYDLLIQCETGLASVTGTPEGPGRVGVSIADLCCGMNAHAAVLQALYERERIGKGKGVATSLFEAMADWMTVPLLQYEYTGAQPKRVGLNHPSIAPYGAYVCGDGKEVVIAIQNEREWKVLCDEVFETPGMAVDPRFNSNVQRCANRPALDAEIALVLKDLTCKEFAARLHAADVAFGSVNTVAELSTHPQLRRMVIGTPSGPASLPASPWRWRDEDIVPRPSPALGAHSAAIRKEFT
jgi:itaconate CoA-transferase